MNIQPGLISYCILSTGDTTFNNKQQDFFPVDLAVSMASCRSSPADNAVHPLQTLTGASFTTNKQDSGPGQDTKQLVDLSKCSISGNYLSCFDMLATDDPTWLVKVTEIPEAPALKGPEQCPDIDSPSVPASSRHETLQEEHLEQVQSMVLKEVLKDIETACKLLNIAPDPMKWNEWNVQKWLLWTEHLYRLPHAGEAFQRIDGRDLSAMSEEDFHKRSPQCSDTLYAYLDIWKSGTKHQITGEEQQSEADSSCSDQPIHLWQFLKELLLKPHTHSRCIRWVNKEKGIFKIEDSAHVARLWGLRKNRPAMNYDKLSRSIRQYYKKGIIRKPDISQRLVYQFVHPI
uniref:SAM pointed domain-containing Ets transcription factor n=1 Tax=Denticeps clupeoides TaxID=299321 RepID=A0AAY4DZV2_9TELE